MSNFTECACHGYTEDLRRVIKHIKGRNPSAPLFSVSYSLGSSMLAKYMGEEGEKSLVDGAVCLAASLDVLFSNRLLLDTLEGRLVNPVLVRFATAVLKEEMEEVIKKDPRFDLDKIVASNSIHEFDQLYNAPLYNHTCVSDLHRDASSGRFLSNLRRPVLYIHASNDPIAPGNIFFSDVFEANPHLARCITKDGAHGMVIIFMAENFQAHFFLCFHSSSLSPSSVLCITHTLIDWYPPASPSIIYCISSSLLSM